MSDSYITIPPDSTGKKVRTTQVVVDGETVHQQVVQLKETTPIDATKTNESFAYTYDGSGNLTQIDQAIGAVTYRKTLSYDGSGNLTSMSSWVIV